MMWPVRGDLVRGPLLPPALAKHRRFNKRPECLALRTRCATCHVVAARTCNIGVVREGSAPIGIGCARGLLLTGDASQVRRLYTGCRAKTVRFRRGLASSNIP
jgi:hypothetical protein